MYVNDNDYYLPYTGASDGHGTRQGDGGGANGNMAYYAANWLYNPKKLAQPVSGGLFVPDDARTGALWTYLDGKLSVLQCPLAEPSDADPAYFQVMSTYIMNLNLSNAGFDGAKLSPANSHYRPLHKINEFPPTSIAFWDYPQRPSIGSNGSVEANGAHLTGPASNGTNWPALSGRHTNIKTIPTDNNFYLTVTGGVPTAFLDGHAEIWPMYVWHDQMNMPGQPEGDSKLWVCPGDPAGRGGRGTPNYTMTEVIGTN
jgi:prepilin-type processing-associated H-X9-DG protein